MLQQLSILVNGYALLATQSRFAAIAFASRVVVRRRALAQPFTCALVAVWWKRFCAFSSDSTHRYMWIRMHTYLLRHWPLLHSQIAGPQQSSDAGFHGNDDAMLVLDLFCFAIVHDIPQPLSLVKTLFYGLLACLIFQRIIFLLT